MSKYQTVCAQFTFKDSISKENLLIFVIERSLNITRRCEGCHSVLCERGDDGNIVTILQKWECKEHHQSYVKCRHEQGYFDFLHTLISHEPNFLT